MRFAKWAVVIIYTVLMLILMALNPNFSIKSVEFDIIVGTVRLPVLLFVFVLSLIFMLITALFAHIEEQRLTNKMEKMKAENLGLALSKVDELSDLVQEKLQKIEGKLSVIEAVLSKPESQASSE
ncbi:MAG: hypothetical protein DRQ10_07230 [Candidatus Hydrothermota bacterium]|nr:MAG: hypothetical protein DRQ10_07230 [Candidatus Hydrothermae bacterium]